MSRLKIKTSISTVLLSLLLAACEGRDNHQPIITTPKQPTPAPTESQPASPPSVVLDNGHQKMMNQKEVIKNKHKYYFSVEPDLSHLFCNEEFVSDSFAFLTTTKEYIQKAALSESVYQSIDDHNNLLAVLSYVVNYWDAKCKNTFELPEETVTYKSHLSFDLEKNISNNIFSTLLEIDDYKKSLLKVLSAARRGQTPSFMDIKNLHLHQQLQLSRDKNITNQEADDFKSRFNKIIESLDARAYQKSFGQFKVEYEAVIEKILQAKIMVNKDFKFISNKIIDGKSDSFAGTLTDLLLNLSARGKNYYSKRPTVILTSGHASPGFLVGHNDEWFLFGIETTTADESIVYYGDVKKIAELQNTVLVVDAFDYLYLTAIQYYISSPKLSAEKMIRNFAEKYKINNFNNLYKKAQTMNEKNSADLVFAFGVNNNKKGNFQRVIAQFSSNAIGPALTPQKVISNITSQMQRKQLSTIKEKMTDTLNNDFYFLSVIENKVQKNIFMYSSSGFVFTPLLITEIKKGTYSCVDSRGYKYYFKFLPNSISMLNKLQDGKEINFQLINLFEIISPMGSKIPKNSKIVFRVEEHLEVFLIRESSFEASLMGKCQILADER